MSAAATWFLPLSRALLWLGGPIFDKELRVASRQKRSYFLRFAYVGLLTCFVAGVWLSFAPRGGAGSVVYQASRMSTAGRYLAVTIVWFQFIAAQVLALVLLSNAISSEIRKRTLHVLAVTPISSMQIVTGKLAGGMLCVATLLATSLPLLAIVRVFGGVPWDYVLSGVCITFTATVFLGALSLYPYTIRRDRLPSFVQTLWYLILCRFADTLLAWLAGFSPLIGQVGRPILQFINPTDVLLVRTQDMLAARSSTGLSFWWPLHCLILLGGSIVVLLLMAGYVRKAAAVTRPDLPPKGRMYRFGQWAGRIGIRSKGAPGQRTSCPRPIRRVEGSPIVWKELHRVTGWDSRSPLRRYGASTLRASVGLAIVVGVFAALGGSLRSSALPALLLACTFGFPVGLVIVFALEAAGAISREREARTLPVLLTTPLDDSEIIKGKAVALLSRALFSVLPLFLPLLFFLAVTIGSTIKIGLPTLVLGAGLYLAGWLGLAPFLLGLGLYCSARFTTTSAATAWTFLVLMLGLMVSLLIGVDLVRPLLRSGASTWLTASVLTIGGALAFTGTGLIFLRAAARRLRRHVF